MSTTSRHRGWGRRRLGAAGLLAALLTVVAAQLLLAAPASAHAELVASTPTNGERLARAPQEIVLRFTESVGLVEDGLELVDTRTGHPVATPDPVAEGGTVRLPLPEDLPDGSYLLSWRVVSADSHPVAGGLAFGVGEAAPAVPGPEATGGAPWQLVLTRWLGYLGFALVAGVVGVVVACWPPGRGDPRTARLLLAGLALGVLGALVGLLLEGPYIAGAPMSRLLDPALLAQVAHTGFGSWTQLRLLLYVALGAVLWSNGGFASAANRWGALVGVCALAVTFPPTGHAAGSGGLLDEAVDGVHVLAAGLWSGGVLVLAGLSLAPGERPGADALVRFSRLALGAVLVLVTTGTVSAVLRLDAWPALWQSRYGQLLLAKLALVAVLLGTAVVSRLAVRRAAPPWAGVRLEAVGVAAVLAVTAVLGLTAPPSDGGGAASSPAADASGPTTLTMDLGEDRRAELRVGSRTTSGSRLRLRLLAADGTPLRARTVELTAALPAQGAGPLDVELDGRRATWHGRFRFPLPGAWTLTLSVEEPDLDAVVTAGRLEIGRAPAR